MGFAIRSQTYSNEDWDDDGGDRPSSRNLVSHYKNHSAFKIEGPRPPRPTLLFPPMSAARLITLCKNNDQLLGLCA